MRILVTGGTGFIGSHLVEKLLSNGHDVTCLVRKTSIFQPLKRIGSKLFFGELTDKSSLKDLFSLNADIVFHCAGILGKWGIPEDLYWRINVHGTKNILDTFFQSDIERFVYCSSAGVSGPLENPPVDESYPCNPSNIYERTKAEAEKLVSSSYDENRFPVTIIRPEFVYGPRDKHVLPLFQSIRDKSFILLGEGTSLLHPTYITDLIQAFDLAINTKKAIGEVYIIAGERFLTIKDFINVVSNALDMTLQLRHVPIPLARIGASVMETLANVFRFDPLLTHSRVDFFTKNYAYYTSKSKEELGYRPVSLEEGIKKTIKWYVENGLL